MIVVLAVVCLLAVQVFAAPTVSPDPVGTAPTDFTVTYPFSAEGKKVSGGQIYFDTSSNITFKTAKVAGISGNPSILTDSNTASFFYMSSSTYTGTDAAFLLTFSIIGSEDGWIRVYQEKRTVTNGPFSVTNDVKSVNVQIPVYRRTPTSSAPVSSTPVSSTPVSSTPVSSTPTSSAPTSSAPMSSAPVSSAPTSSTPVSSTPVSSTPVFSTPTSSTPASSAPVSSTPTSSAPVSSTPTSSAPVSSTPTSSTPVSSTPTSSTPVSSTPTSSAPVSSVPVPSAPVSSTPVSSTPVSSTPVSSVPVSSAPVSSTPVSSVPVSSTPVSSEPTQSDTPANSTHLYWILGLLLAAALVAAWMIARRNRH